MKRTESQFSLTGRVAIITGGSEGLGLDMAEALADAGCSIILTSRRADRAEAAAQRIAEQYKVPAMGTSLDQRFFSSTEEMAREAAQWHGRVDILINNAGGGAVNGEGNLFRRDPSAIADLIAVNLTGVIYCCKTVGAVMSRQGNGKIINIASIAGLVGRNRDLYHQTGLKEQAVDYAAAKAGVIGFTRDLAAFLAPDNVQVNAISPGGFDKGQMPGAFVEAYGKLTMAGRMGALRRDIRGTALFLASPASDYVTGQNLVVDGGFSVFK